MPKQVDLCVEIDETGEKIKVTINGTQGSECLDVMSFLENIESLLTEETVSTDDMQTKEVQNVGKQSVKK